MHVSQTEACSKALVTVISNQHHRVCCILFEEPFKVSDACPSEMPGAVQMCMDIMMPGSLHMVRALLAGVHSTNT